MKKINLTFPFHPFLLAFSPILFFYAADINQLLPNVLIVPLLITFLAVGLLFLILYLIFKNKEKVSLWLSVFILIFFAHGQAQGFLKINQIVIGKLVISENKLIFVLWFILLGAVTVLFLKTRKKLYSTVKFFNIVGLILIAFSLFQIFSYEFKHQKVFSSQKSYDSETNYNLPVPTQEISEKPDIYYFILDRYSSNKTLKNTYHYDNAAFTEFLQDKGFYVTESSFANYENTPLSLSSSLNLDYIQALDEEVAKNPTSFEDGLYDLLNNHRAGNFLKSLGYTYYHLGSWWQSTNQNMSADYNLRPMDEFTIKLLDQTILPSVLMQASKVFHFKNYYNISSVHYAIALEQFQKIAEISHQNSPKFILAHILLPHPPYVFNENCNRIYELQADIEKKDTLPYYLNQLTCTNQKLETLINVITSNSETQPIIILQADEGSYPIVNPVNQTYEMSGNETLREKFGIFSAYYFPNFDRSLFYSDISPVNSLRLVFDYYFKTGTKVLPDKSYLSQGKDHLFEFIDITDRLTAEEQPD